MRIQLFTVIIAALLATSASADEGRFIVDISTKKLYIYDDAGEEKGELKAAAVKKQFSAVPGSDQSGLVIVQEDESEGLLQVRLAEFPEPVWVEAMAVKIWPSARLKCPEVTTSRAEAEQSGMTIGFGEHCDPATE